MMTIPVYFLLGELAVAAVALCFPLALALFPDDAARLRKLIHLDRVTGLAQRGALVTYLDRALNPSAKHGRASGALVLEIDDYKRLEELHDHRAIEQILLTSAQRLTQILRDSDLAARLDGPVFAIALSPVRRLDLESAIQLSNRIQQALSEPIQIDRDRIYITVSVGFSLAERLENPPGALVLQSAMSALIEAPRPAPAASRSYSAAMKTRIASRSLLCNQVSDALENGQIQAYFQPQVSTKTNAITGFETLARWSHPERGLIPPIEFLPALEQAGLMQNLCDLMVKQGLSALKTWDEMGYHVPRVAVNCSNEELRNPKLVDRIGWELDRHDLTPDRLAIEVLETVVANRSDDIIIRNLSALARLGCLLDLDDFGTGHASITTIRRFSIERIKIDRSFITKIDSDEDQQMMVSAILTMADRLGLDTLAEGVENDQELQMLGDLGCHHVQGYGIARPMPLADATRWVQNHVTRKDNNVTLFKRTFG
jgi:diguanylate cyclase (GGDEF)-like protein